mmetsp:Transcript_42101/g.95142  ORF Transcript_42101/g.95142 Transcript_42101/m.95142 type:complete len:246 (-) Transcript_42101:877-1614(-)
MFGAGPVTHTGVNCDHCVVGITGIRYRCAVCPDFDLCSKCYDLRLCPPPPKPGHPAEHLFFRIDQPRGAEKSLAIMNRAGLVHLGVSCNVCATPGPMRGVRHQCVQCALNICEACEFSGQHDPSHTRLKIAVPPPAPAPPAATGSAFGPASTATGSPLSTPSTNSLPAGFVGFGMAHATSGRSGFQTLGPPPPAQTAPFGTQTTAPFGGGGNPNTGDPFGGGGAGGGGAPNSGYFGGNSAFGGGL